MASPQVVKGTCSYSSLPSGRVEKVELKIPIPVSAIMTPEPEELTDILASGILDASSKLARQCSSSNFEEILFLLSSKFCFAVVEQIENAAYLHAKSLQGHHVAFKIKFDSSTRSLSVEGKSNSATILNHLSKEIDGLPL
jgi:flagellar motor switch protein FliG